MHVVHICISSVFRFPCQNDPPETGTARSLEELERATNRVANKAAATVGIKRETGYRYYKKDAASLARRRHNGESERIRRVNRVSGPMCNPGSFLTIVFQPFERVHSRPPAQARGPTPEGGTLYEHAPVADACRHPVSIYKDQKEAGESRNPMPGCFARVAGGPRGIGRTKAD